MTPDVHRDKATDADQAPGPRIAAIHSRRWPRPGEEPIAEPSPALPDPCGRCACVPRRRGSAVKLFPARPRSGWRGPFFFLRCERILDRALTADLPADFHQFQTELLKTAKLGDFLLGFSYCSIAGQGFRYRLAVEFISNSEARTVAGVIGLSAMTSGFSTTSDRAHNGAGAHVVKAGDGRQQSVAMSFQVAQRIGHVEFPFWKYYILPEQSAKKKRPTVRQLLRRTPAGHLLVLSSQRN